MKNNKLQQQIQRNKGQMMILTMLFLVTLSLLIVYGLSGPVVRDYKIASESLMEKQSYFLAESSIDDVYYRVKNGVSVASSETLYNGSDFNTITVTDIGGGQKQVTSVSNVSGRDRTVSSVIQTTTGTTMHLNYAIQSGYGGFTLSNNATIYGSVYSNGNISGGNGSSIQGSAYAANSETLTADQQNNTPATPSGSLTFGNSAANQDFGQSFSTTTTDKLNKVQFYIKRVGASPGALTVRITGDNAGKPSSTTVTSATVASNLVSTSYQWVQVTFTGAVLDAGAPYWLVLDAASANASNYYIIGTNTGTYSGVASLGSYSGGTWTSQTSDGYFNIYIGGFTSTISGVSVSGTANANTVTGSTVTGTLYCQTGSSNNKACNTTSAVPSPLPFPISTAQIDAWKAEAAAGGTVSSMTTTNGATATIGPKKINGNLTVGNNGVLTVNGTLWVTGNVDISNNAVVKLASAYGASTGVIIADGTINLSNNGVFQGSGTTGSYVLVISTIDTNGSDAISIGNNAGAVLLYAPYGQLTISNNAGATQVMASNLILSNNATITYDTNLSNATVGTGGNSGSMSIVSWKETQ